MKNRSVVLWWRRIAVTLMTICICGSAFAQGDSGSQKLSFDGSFATMRPEQREMVLRWVAEYNRINGTRLEPEKVYDELPASFRTTFDAVTHALLTSTLTDQEGNPIGTALSLVEMVESIQGKIIGAPSDRQFRLYVVLKKDAVEKLYAAREFKRTAESSRPALCRRRCQGGGRRDHQGLGGTARR